MYSLTDADGNPAPIAGRPQEQAQKRLASAVERVLKVTTAQLRGENNTTKIKWRFANVFDRSYETVLFNDSYYATIIVSGDTFVSRPQVEGNQLVCLSYHIDDMGKEVNRTFWRDLPDFTRYVTVWGPLHSIPKVYEDAYLLSIDDVNYVYVVYKNLAFSSIERMPRLKELVPIVKGNKLTYTVYVHSREVESDVSLSKVAEMLQVKTEDLQMTGLGSDVADLERPRYVVPDLESPLYNWSDAYSLPSVSPGWEGPRHTFPPGAESPLYGEPRWRSYGSAAPRVNTVSWNVLLLLPLAVAWLV